MYLYLCVRICICVCVFVFVFAYLYLYLIMTTFCFGLFFDENPFLRLRLASHDNLGVFTGTGSVLGDRASETLFEGIPGQLFDSPVWENC